MKIVRDNVQGTAVVSTFFFLVGCAANSITNAKLAVERGIPRIVEATKNNNYSAYYKAIDEMKTAYQKAIGYSPVMSLFTDKLIELGKVSEEEDKAIERGESTDAYNKQKTSLAERIAIYAAGVQRELQWVERADQVQAEKTSRSLEVVNRAFVALLIVGIMIGAARAGGSGGSSAVAPDSQNILLFGGTDHRTFLGCLSCSQFDRESIFNQFGPYGSYLSAQSIWNSFGLYGSQFSSLSVCSELASAPPVVVDKAGNFYGRLSVNTFKAGRDDLKQIAIRICSSR